MGHISDVMQVFLILAFVASASAASRTCYGDVMTLHPTGKHNGGVAGSNSEARHDLTELNKRKSCYDQAADENCVQASVIAAIASRETRGGSLLYSTNGYGDHGHGWGIMQCDLYTSGMNSKALSPPTTPAPATFRPGVAWTSAPPATTTAT